MSLRWIGSRRRRVLVDRTDDVLLGARHGSSASTIKARSSATSATSAHERCTDRCMRRRHDCQSDISADQISATAIPVPPLHEQRAIAHILGTLDDKIELNRRMNETLEAMARALFKSWFVDFDPVRAKAEGRDPGLPKPLADLFPARLVDSELGEIPEGWEVGTLAELARSLNPEVWPKRHARPRSTTSISRTRSGGRIEAVTTYGTRTAPSRASASAATGHDCRYSATGQRFFASGRRGGGSPVARWFGRPATTHGSSTSSSCTWRLLRLENIRRDFRTCAIGECRPCVPPRVVASPSRRQCRRCVVRRRSRCPSSRLLVESACERASIAHPRRPARHAAAQAHLRRAAGEGRREIHRGDRMKKMPPIRHAQPRTHRIPEGAELPRAARGRVQGPDAVDGAARTERQRQVDGVRRLRLSRRVLRAGVAPRVGQARPGEGAEDARRRRAGDHRDQVPRAGLSAHHLSPGRG